MKITAVVVTFNRLALLKECIAGLKRQTSPVNEIIVVNNGSSDGTDVWLAEQVGLTVATQENVGGSGGQYSGIRKAMENGADWIWCMDDDAEPYPDALEQLIPYFSEDKGPVAALACAVIDKSGELQLLHRGFYNYKTVIRDFGCQAIAESDYTKEIVPLEYATFVGIMINRKAIGEAGLPKRELFLHFDDIEYSLRLGRYGSIVLVPKSKILHKENSSNHFFVKRVFGKERVRIKYEKLWLRYYVTRNVTWGLKEYYGKHWDLKLVLAMYYIRSVSGILLFDDHKRKRIVFLTRAMKDGLSAKFENGYAYINGRTKLYKEAAAPNPGSANPTISAK